MSSVDVIIPCYRYGHYLQECVESALTQSGVDVRVLIIDDASPDNTAEVGVALARRYPRVTFSRHPVNKGHIATYNEGLEWASADYLLLLSADDFVLPNAFGRAVALMDRHAEIGFCFGRAEELADGNELRRRIPFAKEQLREQETLILSESAFIGLSGARNIVPTPTAIVRTASQKRVGGYRAHLPHTGDMEMWLRLAAHAPVGVLGASQAVYRRHAANMSLGYRRRDDLEHRRAALDSFLQQCADVLDRPQELRRLLLRSLAYEAVGAASSSFNEGKFESCLDLSTYAVDLYPRIETSMPWLKLAAKRRLGLRGWTAVQPAVATLRQAMFFVRKRGG